MLNSLEHRLSSAKAFVFDFYGTLVEDDISVPPMWHHLNQLGYASHPELEAIFEPNAFDGLVTPPWHGDPNHDAWLRANWRQFVRLSGVPEAKVDNILQELMAVQDTFRAKAVTSAHTVLRLLRQRGIRLGLCSNWEHPIQPYLEQAGLPEFDAIAVSAELGVRKPNTIMFCYVCSQLEVALEEAVFVGDYWPADVVGALRAGMTPVWIRHYRPSRGLTHLVAEFDTLIELETYLTRIL